MLLAIKRGANTSGNELCDLLIYIKRVAFHDQRQITSSHTHTQNIKKQNPEYFPFLKSKLEVTSIFMLSVKVPRLKIQNKFQTRRCICSTKYKYSFTLIYFQVNSH